MLIFCIELQSFIALKIKIKALIIQSNTLPNLNVTKERILRILKQFLFLRQLNI